MIDIYVANNIAIHNLPAHRLQKIKQALTIPNPAYEKVARITGNRFAAQATFKYYREKDGVLTIPRGMFTRITKWLESVNEQFVIHKDLTCVSIAGKVPSSISFTLKPHQSSAVEAAKQNMDGIIHSGTGTGKTIIGLEIIRQQAVTALILVPNSVMLKQFVDEAKQFFNWDIGQIGDGKKDIYSVSVATWQSLSADKELLNKISTLFSTIMIDEVQGVVSDERMKILRAFKPLHIYGLTATPHRSSDDGRTKAIAFISGAVIHSFESTMMKPSVEIINSKTDIPWQGDYHAMIENMANNTSRNTLISGLAIGEAGGGKKVLILLKRREHCQRILEKLNGLNVFYADSDNPSRNEILLSMRKNNYNFSILIGTLSLLSAGVDIPSLDVLIIGADLKSEVLLEQSAGRVLRLFAGKTEAKIYDIYDYSNPILRKQFYNRLSVYRQKGWEIINDFNKKTVE